jgi:hypothetical protein
MDIGGKARRKETTRRPKCRWVNSVKMDLRETEWSGMDWIDLAEDGATGRLCEHGNESLGSIKCWEVFEQLHNWLLLKKGSAA